MRSRYLDGSAASLEAFFSIYKFGPWSSGGEILKQNPSASRLLEETGSMGGLGTP